MKGTVEYKGRNYSAWLTEWTSGETTATIKVGKAEVLLHFRRTEDGGVRYRK